MNPTNTGQIGQGQMGQPTPNGEVAPQGQARGPPMYRPEIIRQMTFLAEEEKARYEPLIRQCWQQLEANGPDASEARRKILEFSRAMFSKAQQARTILHQKHALQVQQQAQAQQLQHQAQSIVKQQPQQVLQGQPQQGHLPVPGQGQPQPSQIIHAVPKTTAPTPTSAAVPTTTPALSAATSSAAPNQIPQSQKLPDHIIQHVNKVPYHPPPDILQKGPDAVKTWQMQYRNKYAMILVNMEKTKQTLRGVEMAIRQSRDPPLTAVEIKTLQDQREGQLKRHADMARWVESFRKNQQDAMNQRVAAQAGAAGGVAPGVAPGTGIGTGTGTVPGTGRPRTGAGPGVGTGANVGSGAGLDQKPLLQAGVPSTSAPNAAAIQAMRQKAGQLNTQNVTATVSAAIEAAKNQQLPAGPIGRLTQQGTNSQPQGQPPTTGPSMASMTGVTSPAITTGPTSVATTIASTTALQPIVKTEPGTAQPQQHHQHHQHPPPVNTAIASSANVAAMSANGTPTTGRVPPTPKSATIATPTSAVPRPLPHNQAVNAANAANVRAGQLGAAGAPGQASTGAVAGPAAQSVQAHPHTHLGQPPTISSKFAISKQLPEKSTAIPTAVPMPTAARPTMTQGGGIAGGVMGQPAVGKPPGFTFEGEAKHVLSKTKLDELCRQVCGGTPEGSDGNYLASDVEELVLNLADHFVDDVIRKACMIAKERGSKTLDIRDLQLILERSYNIRVPGYSSDELRTIRKSQPTTAWITKMSAVQAAKVTARNGDL